MTNLATPPVAERREHHFTHHGVTIEDPYAWLRDPGYPHVSDAQVLDYLKAENAYCHAAFEEPNKALIDAVFEEMKGRIKEDLSSVPLPDDEYEYWWAFRPGAQYRTWFRRSVEQGGDRAEQVIFDEAAEAEGKQYFRLGALEVSPDGRYAAVMVDDDGSERFQLRIRDYYPNALLQMRDQAPAARTERDAGSQLALPACRLAQNQAGDVRAANREHQRDGELE